MPDAKKRPRKRARKSKPGDELAPATTDAAAAPVEAPSASAAAAPSAVPVAAAARSSQAAPASAAAAAPVSRSKSYAKPAVPAPAAAEASSAGASFYDRVNPHKPSALPRLAASRGPRRYTLSVALPGAIVRNAQTPELQARLAGHIARTCAIFCVDEIVVFDEGAVRDEAAAAGEWKGKAREENDGGWGDEAGEQPQRQQQGGAARGFDPNAFLARLLQYLETPQYLRKALFPMHRDLRLAGLLPPLDLPHHLRFEDHAPYREGVTVDAPHWAHSAPGGNRRAPEGVEQVWVNVGLRDPIEADVKGASVPVGARVTVKMPEGARHKGRLVSPREPVEAHGQYWGYSVRLCPSLSNALTTAPFASANGGASAGGYDLLIGTSERGAPLTHVLSATALGSGVPYEVDGQRHEAAPLPAFDHALVVLGGLSGLEVAVEADAGVQLGADEAHELFDAWIDVAEGQGSRTIRTEEALMITLARLKSALEGLGR